jgi:hypothetical protein
MSFQLSKIVADRFFWLTACYVAEDNIEITRIRLASDGMGNYDPLYESVHIQKGESFLVRAPFWKQFKRTLSSKEISFVIDLDRRWVRTSPDTVRTIISENMRIDTAGGRPGEQ